VIKTRHCRTASSRKPHWLRAALVLVTTGFSAAALADDLITKIEARAIGELWLNPGMYSYHFNRQKHHNDNNYGFGAEYRFSTVASVTAGRYYNSDREYSNYVGLYYQPFAIGPVRVGAVIGGFDGYSRMHDGGWFLAAIPMLGYEYGRVGLNVAIIPSYGDRLHGAIAFQLKVKVLD
jgi:hypothetical protein